MQGRTWRNMPQCGSISYLKEGGPSKHKTEMYVNINTKLRFETIATGMARMYFTNLDGIPSNTVPEGVVVHKDIVPNAILPVGASFYLSWEHSYIITVNNAEYFVLRRQKQHCIRPTKAATALREAVGAIAAQVQAQAQAEIAQAATVVSLSALNLSGDHTASDDEADTD